MPDRFQRIDILNTKRFHLILLILFAMHMSPCYADSLESLIQTRMKEFGAESVGIYFQDSDGRTFTYNADEVFHAASTMKVPVMMELFRQIEAGKLQSNAKVPIRNEFRSIEDGSTYSLTKEDDGDTELYDLIGKSLPLQQLIETMINKSSNLATNMLIEVASAKNVMELMGRIGATDMTVLRGVEDIKAYEAGKNNTTSARALARCLQAILNPEYFSKTSQAAMMKILLSQHYHPIADGLHAEEQGLMVASKNGWITEIYHDAAIIRTSEGEDSILVIMTRGVPEVGKGAKLVGQLASDIWNHYTRGGQEAAGP